MYGLNLDDIMEELFLELELVQDGKASHRIAIDAKNKSLAAKDLSQRLQDFFYKNMYECDDHGEPV